MCAFLAMCKALLSFISLSLFLSFSVCVYVCVCLCCQIIEMYCCVALQQGACRSEQHFGSHISSKQGGGKRRREGVVCACIKVCREGEVGLALLSPTHVVSPVPSMMCTCLSAQEVSLCVFL